jgi:hypothetical protein
VGLRHLVGIISRAHCSYRYGAEFESYIDTYLRTPGIDRERMVAAMLARGRARRQEGEQLLAKATQGWHLTSRESLVLTR